MTEPIYRDFSISYYSEVSAKLKLVVYPNDQDPRICATATHLQDSISIHDWFHFCDKEVDGVEIWGDTIHSVMANLGDELYPGAEPVMQDSLDDKKTQFFTDLYLAFVYGHWSPANGAFPTVWKHNVGERLLRKV